MNGAINPKLGNEKKKKKRKIEFELCKVCNINHDEGNRHKYFPNHKKSLSTLLTSFYSKLAGLRNPTALPRSRLWCIFCDADAGDSSGTLPRHLASEEHAKKVKWFLWKYGGREKDRVETYCFTESDVAKWEVKCKSGKSEAVSFGNVPDPGSRAGRVNGMSIRYHILEFRLLEMAATLHTLWKLVPAPAW